MDYTDLERLQKEFLKLVEKCIVYNVTTVGNILANDELHYTLFRYHILTKDASGISHVSKHNIFQWIFSYLTFLMLMTEALVLGVGIGICQFLQWLLRIFRCPNVLVCFFNFCIFFKTSWPLYICRNLNSLY
jgi:hypothetical protein